MTFLRNIFRRSSFQRSAWIPVLALTLAVALIALPLALRAQQAAPQGSETGHSGHDMSGHDMSGMSGEGIPSDDMSGHDMSHMEGMDHMAMSGQTGGRVKSPEELAEDKRFSEFNHHFAGVFVLLVGLLAMIEPYL